MSTAAVELRPVATPSRIGQATAVEQSRAIAEVQAQVVVAQQFPRSVTAAVRAMEDACKQPQLAQRAFFRYPRAGETVSGASVYLARELARCWGNVQHGITELLRDDVHGQSEMMAWAWDVETNTRSSNTFIVPHKRDTKSGTKDLTDMRDIYENNANNGARRLREAIFSVLPAWYTEQAKALCTQTIEHGGGQPLPQRIAEAVKAYEQFRVSPARLAAKFGHASVDELTAADVGQLRVIYDSLRQGTVTVDEEFPPEPNRITAADITGQGDEPRQEDKPAARGRRSSRRAAAQDASPAQSATRSAAPAAPVQDAGEAPAAGGEHPTPQLASSGQAGLIRQHFERLGYSDSDDDKAARLRITARLASYDGELTSTKKLSADQAASVLRQIQGLRNAQELEDLINDGVAPEEVPGDE